MIKDSEDNLYVGITKNPEQRLAAHNKHQGAQFTKKHNNFRIVFLEEHSSLTDARRREIQIKKWRRDKKEMLIERYTKRLSTKQ
jgi:putative endonuclease